MVHFETSRVEFHVHVQRDMQPYSSSHVAVWKTGQGRGKLRNSAGIAAHILCRHSLDDLVEAEQSLLEKNMR